MEIISANKRNGFLYREPLPVSIHGFAPRSAVKPYTWKKITDAVRGENNFVCCICGGDYKENTRLLHTHELYSFNTTEKTAKIVDLIPICVNCHNVIHFLGSMNRGISPIKMLLHQWKVNKGKRPNLRQFEVSSRWRQIGEIKYIDCTYFRKYVPTLPDRKIKKGQIYQ